MKNNDKIAIVCCSNGIKLKDKYKIDMLINLFIRFELVPVISRYIFEQGAVFSGNAKQRAEVLMDFYKDKEIKAIFDISGGDIANEILPFLDFEIIKKNKKLFWGYSDLTTIINAIYTKTNNESILYQIKNLVAEDMEEQTNNFYESLFLKTDHLYYFNYEFIQGNSMQGVVVGGNIRCFLKLAGTEYWPNLNNKILLLEARSGTIGQMTTYLSQLKQIGVFEKVNGIILGRFIEMENKCCIPTIIDLVKRYINRDLPLVKTSEVGHNIDSKAMIIGKMINLR